jgi:hypothetical protein
MTEDSERSTEAAHPRQSWVVPIIALAMFALFAWLFLGGRGDPPADGRERPAKKSESASPAREGVRE